jgi:DSF synthase
LCPGPWNQRDGGGEPDVLKKRPVNPDFLPVVESKIVMESKFYKIFDEYEELSIRYDEKHEAVWCYFNPAPRPCFSLRMLQEMRQVQQRIIDYFESRQSESEPLISYLVIHSQIPGIYNMGGDLALFGELIRQRNRESLIEYAKQCIEICYLNSVSLHLPITTISLVEGAALGGGFESALSSNILIATENAEMGFPEVRFNLFPGMGAYSFLARKCGVAIAERLISSGDVYSARELYDQGIVTHVAEKDMGLESVEQYIRQHKSSNNCHRALQQIRLRYHPIDYRELEDITVIWADAALRMQERDLRLIDRLAQAQLKKMSSQSGRALLRTRQDRRFSRNDVTFPITTWSGEEIEVDRRQNPDRRGLQE